MSEVSRKNLSRTIAKLVPNIIQGAQLGFLASRDITHTQFFILIAIHSKTHCTMKTLADNMSVSMPTISGTVDRLVKAHYVERVDNPDDRRQVMVGLTKEGQKLIAQFQEAVGHRWEEVLNILNQKELESLQLVIMKLIQGLEKKE